MQIVHITAEQVIDNKNGTFTVYLPSRDLNEPETKLLRSIFPNLMDQAYDLMNKECLLNSLAQDIDAAKPPTIEGTQPERTKSKPTY